MLSLRVRRQGQPKDLSRSCGTMPRVTKRALQQLQSQPATQAPSHPETETQDAEAKPGYRPRREHTGAAADAHVEVTLSPEETVLADAIV